MSQMHRLKIKHIVIKSAIFFAVIVNFTTCARAANF